MIASLIELNARGDARGGLVAIEDFEVGFEIRRVYFIYGTGEGVIRGLHAHRALRQVAVAVKGRCTFLLDDGREGQTIVLDNPAQGLPIEPMVWHEMTGFSPECVLMVLASAPYDEADYIRDYQEFRSIAAADNRT